jgi:hypothetical protein
MITTSLVPGELMVFPFLIMEQRESLNTTFPEEMKALSGMRVNRYGQAGINISNGALNAPPVLRFTVQKGTSDTREEDIAIHEINNGIKVITSGTQVREQVAIPAGSTKAQAITLIRQALEKRRPVQVYPQAGGSGFSTFTTGGANNIWDTAWTTE